MKRCFNGKVYFFSYLIFYENVPSGFKTRHVFKLRFYILYILHHAPAALLQAENLIHLNAGLSLLGYLFSVWVVCVHFILFIQLFLCSI